MALTDEERALDRMVIRDEMADIVLSEAVRLRIARRKETAMRRKGFQLIPGGNQTS